MKIEFSFDKKSQKKKKNQHKHKKHQTLWELETDRVLTIDHLSRRNLVAKVQQTVSKPSKGKGKIFN